MIIDDEKISTALEYLNEYPHPGAIARKQLRTAEISRDKLFASLFLKTTGNVKERECQVTVEPEYTAACKTVIEFESAVERERARVKGAEMLIEVWRSEQANTRAAERVR